MIDLYTWSTPNGRKVSIFLEEVGLEYEVHPVNITKDEQFAPEFLEFSPNNKIPAIVDREAGVRMMEAGAILLYLAEKTGTFQPSDAEERRQVMQWLMMQTGSVGPMLGQAHHFLKFNRGAAPYAEERYGKEARRIYGVLDRRLDSTAYLAGPNYGIADIATWPWIARFEWQDIDMKKFPNVLRWYQDIASRDAVRRGYDVPKINASIPVP
ncbi:MAG: glutathione S-transferase N-terminal domain-containing protein [Rhodospirillales bacterium]|nr:glutathione S-transferase N-terminal domain-containing protein [Rhodospirillales bacterium]